MNMSAIYLLFLIPLCIQEISSCDCPNAWTVYGESCYMHGHDSLSFSDAEAFCKHRHGHLAHIDDAAENSFIKSYLSVLTNGKHWIGLTDTDTEGVWKWQDSDSVASYLNWNHGQPNQGLGANCAAIWGGGYGYNWVDESCSNLFQPLCEQPCLTTGQGIVG